MHSLIINPIAPPVPGRDSVGMHLRMRLFVRALGSISRKVTILYLTPPQHPSLAMEAHALAAQQSEFWTTAVEPRLVRTGTTSRSFKAHYLDGLIEPMHQPDFHRFSGPDQVAGVARAFAEGPDLVLAQRFHAMVPLLAGRLQPRRLAFDLDDLEYKMRWRAASAQPLRFSKVAYLAHAARLFPAVATAIRRANATSVCSDVDQAHLGSLHLGRKVQVVPNAVPFPSVVQDTPAAKVLLFLGNLEYEPNRQGAERLVQRIWPLVLARHADARLVIAGRGAERVGGFTAPPPGVSFPGHVASLDDLYAGAGVVCCPITMGGGTRLKIIEAAAYAKPVVSTHLGAEGLDLRDGQELLLRDDDGSFADACADLLADPSAAARLGAAARVRARTLYEAGMIEQRISQLLSGL